VQRAGLRRPASSEAASPGFDARAGALDRPVMARRARAQGHYGGGLEFRAAVKATLRRMVGAGRLEAVPGRLGLFRLGGVVRQLTEGASLGWPAGDAGPTLGDARVRPARTLRAWPGFGRALATLRLSRMCHVRQQRYRGLIQRAGRGRQRCASARLMRLGRRRRRPCFDTSVQKDRLG